jgi:hypothetical protein
MGIKSATGVSHADLFFVTFGRILCSLRNFDTPNREKSQTLPKRRANAHRKSMGRVNASTPV